MKLRHKYSNPARPPGLRSLPVLILISVVMTVGFATGALGASGKADRIYSEQFEKAVGVIKKYEGLHKNHSSLIGYGHQVIAGDRYKRRSNLTPAQADALLRDDLAKLCARYRSFGKDSLLLAALAYNCGIGTVAKSSVYKKLKAGNREIKENYLSHCRAGGKVLSQLKRRREEEFRLLFSP